MASSEPGACYGWSTARVDPGKDCSHRFQLTSMGANGQRIKHGDNQSARHDNTFQRCGRLANEPTQAIPHSTCWRLTVTMGHSPISKCRPRKTTSRPTDWAKPRSGTHAALSSVRNYQKNYNYTTKSLPKAPSPVSYMSAGNLSSEGSTNFKFSPSHTALDSRSVLAGTGLSHQSSPYLNMDPHLE